MLKLIQAVIEIMKAEFEVSQKKEDGLGKNVNQMHINSVSDMIKWLCTIADNNLSEYQLIYIYPYSVSVISVLL